jgi:hypothetical protein
MDNVIQFSAYRCDARPANDNGSTATNLIVKPTTVISCGTYFSAANELLTLVYMSDGSVQVRAIPLSAFCSASFS